MTSARYDIHGLRLSADAEDGFLLGCLDGLVKEFAVPATGDAAEFSVSMRYGLFAPSPAPPPALRQFWSGELAGGARMTYFTGPTGRLIDMLGFARMRLDLTNRSADLVVTPPGDHDRAALHGALVDGCIVPLLCEFLAAIDGFVMHAACLGRRIEGGKPSVSGPVAMGPGARYDREPRRPPLASSQRKSGAPDDAGRDGVPAILLTGASGRGKTTASLALAHAGWAFLTDDVTIICDDRSNSAAPLTAWGLARPCKVLDNTLTLLPWLAELDRGQRRRSGERAIDVVAEMKQLAARPERVRPRAVFFLDPPNPQGHRITPLDKLAAVTLMIRENLRAVETAASGSSARAFQTFTRLVGQCETYLLSAGPRMEELPSAIDAALGGRAGDRPAG
jgi:hypothetical protein